MKLIDRIALERLLKLILNFIVRIISLFAPQTQDTPKDKKIWRPKWRKNS